MCFLKHPYHIHCVLKLCHKMLSATRKQANYDNAVCCPQDSQHNGENRKYPVLDHKAFYQSDQNKTSYFDS